MSNFVVVAAMWRVNIISFRKEQTMSTAISTPYRYDVVGSFLRPKRLHDARKRFEAGNIGKEELASVEDAAITELVAKEKAAGLHVITDGEFRRATWHLDFMWQLGGVSHQKTHTGLPFHGEQAMIDDTFLTGKICPAAHHSFVDHFRFTNSLSDATTVAKQTIPAPAQTFAQFAMPFALSNTRKYYKTDQDLIDDIAVAYRVVIDELYQAGCRNLQFDDCTWPMTVDKSAPEMWDTSEAGLRKVREKLLCANNLVLEGLPADLTVNTHICRGNFHSTYACSGPYDDVADYVLAREHVHAFFLEFDDERSGGFAPLAKVPEDKLVVLGLITTKSAALEDKDAVIARISQAKAYVPLRRLCLSPQCGFASCEIGNKLTEDQQWAKVRLVRDIAKEVWGE
jgi:5-methyltetrahydropteroyltriglutamate--homocysteine methyltransferase